MQLALIIVGGVLLLIAVIAGSFFGIRGAIRRRFAELRAALEVEGVVLDSGMRSMTARFRDFRAPGFYAGVAVRSGPGQIVLTRKHLVFLGSRRLQPVPHAELGRYTAESRDGSLVLRTERPFGASGSVEVRVSVDDPAAWVRELHAAGAVSA